MIDRVSVEGYRSLRSLTVDLTNLTVVTGHNGAGKSNLYRALGLLASCGSGGVVPALAREGGLDAVRWAGPEGGAKYGTQGTVRSKPVAVKLGFGAGDDLGYAIDLGLPVAASGFGAPSAFDLDPHIKQEHVFAGLEPRPAAVLAERVGPLVRGRQGRAWREVVRTMPPWQSMLDEVAGNSDVPEVLGIRRTLRSWRFHDAMRTDAAAPARGAHVATRSPRLDDDGGNVAAVLRTTMEQGDDQAVVAAVSAAFPGSRLHLERSDGRMRLGLQQYGLLRPLDARELSDGTLQYLLLIAALTSLERPSLTVLNEPERSLHSSLMAPLARLVAEASRGGQVLVVTHDQQFADALQTCGASEIRLARHDGETIVLGREGPLDVPIWHWPKR